MINAILQLSLYLFVLLILVKPVGWYIAAVYRGHPCGLNTLCLPFEKCIYKICAISPQDKMDWKSYLTAMLMFNLFGILFVYGIERLQFSLPFNPQSFPNVSPNLAFNTAASFVTNTNWQAYSGEITMSYFTQMLALTVQNFLSAATGLALLFAFIRGLTKQNATTLGNFWVDIVRGTLYILIPFSLILAIVLSSQGVIQNFKPSQSVSLLQPLTYTETITDHSLVPHLEKKRIDTQTIPMGPVASQIAIKQLGTNGGGFFNTNSAHPFENPTPFTNFLEMLAILLIPAALCYSFGLMVHDKRQGWALLIAMLIMFIPAAGLTILAEQQRNPSCYHLGLDQLYSLNVAAGGNMEGKETRFGIVNSALWAAATTATANGSVNSMLDSYTPIGGMIPLWLMHLGEVVFGGIGSGLYGMLVLVIITVFIAGLMVGRSPEYLGKKIEPYEIKMASFTVLLMPLTVLLLTAIAIIDKSGIASIANPGPHGFSEILYAFTSMGNNNGSAFAGLNANTPFYNLIGGAEMLFLRFWLAIPTLAIAGSLVKKKIVPQSSGTLPTHTFLFIILLICVTLIIGALSFFPALCLGPVVEHLMLWEQYAN